ncbi:MAG: hypothetical protein J2O48_11565 [Solirubrobacterales bacterium]|nr:hypothetical protein [Solirubrobacterales bacterium]
MIGGEDRLPPMTPQLALRVAVVGSCALVMFAIIFLRLWFLQVLGGTNYVAQAKTNEVRSAPVSAPRGRILAANNSVLVDSEKVPAILISPPRLPVPMPSAPTKQDLVNPPAANQALYNRLAPVLGLKTTPAPCKFTLVTGHKVQHVNANLAEIPCLVARQASQVAYSNVTLAVNVPIPAQEYISERAPAFPGVTVTQSAIRKYPRGDMAAQVLGTVGPINASSLKNPKFKGIPFTDQVGQTGLEYEYNQYLQGKDGSTRVRVNSFGQLRGYGAEKQPVTGYDLKTSLDPGLQAAGEKSLATSVKSSPGSNGGAFVAMNPDTGSVYGMGSYPSFNPGVFSKPMSEQAYAKKFGAASGSPLLNRATQSAGPTGSTFKVITATAALQSHTWSTSQTYDDTGKFCPSGSSGPCEHNSGGEAFGVVNLQKALQVSDDVFFYNLGLKLNWNPQRHPSGGPLQQWAKKFGIGETPGVDLPFAAKGNRPDPNWRNSRIKEEQECDSATGAYAYTNSAGSMSAKPLPGYHRSNTHPKGGCGIAAYPFRGWSEGDNVNMAVGQGDVQASPVQLAQVYSAIANGGKVPTPHVGESIDSPSGSALQQIQPPPERKLGISPATIGAIQSGLRAATQNGGTSGDVMGGFKMPVYGKTGTAQYISKGVETDDAWYACFVPSSATKKPIVVVVWVSHGGFGDTAAAPVAKQILSQWFYGKPGPYTPGSNNSR